MYGSILVYGVLKIAFEFSATRSYTLEHVDKRGLGRSRIPRERNECSNETKELYNFKF